MGDLYHWYKEHGVCPGCRKADAVPGMVHCPDCLYKMQSKNSKRDPQKIREDAKKRYRDKRARGQCAFCSNQARPGKTSCERCARKKRVYDNERYAISMRRENGICRRCDKPVVPGQGYCEEHLKKEQENGRRTIVFAQEALKERRKKDEYIW